MAKYTPKERSNKLPSKESPIKSSILDPLVTAERSEKFKQVLLRRTNQIAIVVENCHDQHNATAIIRSCDAFGIHPIHIVTGKANFKVNNRVTRGSHNFANLNLHESISQAYDQLRKEGYDIYASDLCAENSNTSIELKKQLSSNKKIALVFGEEGDGLTQEAIDLADQYFLIPMVGFSQSLNVSVSVAVTLYSLREEELCNDKSGNLSADEQQLYYEKWIERKKTREAKRIIEEATKNRTEMELDVYEAGK